MSRHSENIVSNETSLFSSRRTLLQLSGSCVAFPVVSQLFEKTLFAETQGKEYEPLNRFPRMIHEYFVDQVRQAEQRGLSEQKKLKTKSDAERYVDSVRKKIRLCFGEEPERTPLNPRITGVVERDGYNIEKLIFESRPGFPVTANVYVPTNQKTPLPGVIGTCGHSRNGKAEKAYQSFSQGLARQGYVCLIYDPIGQGERYQYIDEELHHHLSPVGEHLYAGNQQFLVGEFFGAWRAWDGIRALDYLLTRKEVAPEQVGVTGNSGGGTMTTWLCGVESRWKFAAPSCFVTTFRRNMENELPADTEQCPPKALALGLDHSDFLAAMAPKAVRILAKERDFFDSRGAEEAAQRLEKLYRLLEKPEQSSLFIGPTTHGFTQENREAMYEWFNKETQKEILKSEPEITIEKDETLWCTPKGQLSLETKTVFDFTRERSLKLKETRSSHDLNSLKKAVRNVLKLRSLSEQVPDYRILKDWKSRDYPQKYGISYAIETEKKALAIAYMLTETRWYSRPTPKTKNKRAILYVSHRSSDHELRTEPLIRELLEAEPESTLFTCDVRGIGESKPNTCGTNSFDSPYGCDYFYAIHSLMLDRPYVGQKTFDVLRVLQWLNSCGYSEVHLVGKGWGALPATFASLFSHQVKNVTLKNGLSSYAAIAENEEYHWPLSTFLPDVLSHFDLPDCYKALTEKNLRQIDPWDQNADHEEKQES